MNMKKNPFIISATVSAKQSVGWAERDLIRRHQAALKQMDQQDAARELRPHTPRLANEVLRSDDTIAVDWEALEKMTEKVGPRTGTHPMATRIRPALAEAKPLPGYRRELIYGAANLAIIAAAMWLAAWVAS